MSKPIRALLVAALTVLSMTVQRLGAEPPATDDKPAASAPKLTVAVLDFSARDPANPDLGRQLGEALTASLSGDEAFTLVDRQSIQRTVQEHELNLTGLVDTDQAIKVGKLVGARIIITGSAFSLGKRLIVTAKLIGTETSLVDSVAVKGSADADLGDLVGKVAEKVTARIHDAGPKLVASSSDAEDPLPGLKEKLSGRKLPTVAVIITEEHHGAPVTVTIVQGGHAADPPVETEMKQVLIAAGFTVKDVPQNDLAKFAKDWKADNVDSWPRSLANVDVLITGESFSEFAAHVGNLTSCTARAEINVIGRKDGKIIQADQGTARAADLSENIAAKTALQKTGRAMAIRTLDFFARTLPASKPKAKDAAASKP